MKHVPKKDMGMEYLIIIVPNWNHTNVHQQDDQLKQQQQDNK